MTRHALLIAAAGTMIFLGPVNAADRGPVNSLSDLDSGAADYQYIYPHAVLDRLPPGPYTNVPPVRPAPNAAPLPPRADVPIDTLYSKTRPQAAGSDAQR